MEGSPIEKPINALHSEHLREGVLPIRASIIESGNIDAQTSETISQIKQNGQSIDYYQSTDYFQKNSIKNQGTQTYVISEINGSDKYSEGYANCTGIVLVGIDKKTQENISILSHQDPEAFLDDMMFRQEFQTDLSDTIKKFTEQCDTGTIDAVVFGGNDYSLNQYRESITFLGTVCQKELGFEPVVLTGPNIASIGRTNISFDTKNRRLYLMRPKQLSELNESYMPSDIKNMNDIWPV